MKIRIENFGPIHSFEFDLDKDFHVIYGKNNIGKSYAISVVYLFIKNIINERKNAFGRYFQLQNRLALREKVINSVQEKLKNNTRQNFSIQPEIEEYIQLIIEHSLVQRMQKSLENSFSSFQNIQNQYSKEELRITLLFSKGQIVFSIDENQQLMVSSVSINSISTHVQISKTKKEISSKVNELVFFLPHQPSKEKIIALTENAYSFAVEFVLNTYDEVVHTCNDIFYLPASRSGLYEAMSIFSSVFARLSQLRHLVNESIEIPALSEPISDYFLNLSTIKAGNTNDSFSKFATEIEEKILGATIRFNNDNKKLEYFNEAANLKLDLSDTSSMISEIAPIVAYLKYIVNEKEDPSLLKFGASGFEQIADPSKILFIEEPEAHLHPEVQVLLMDIFAKLTQNKVKIALTTHSNYFFNKVNNLIVNEELNIEKVANYHIINTPKGSIVNDNNPISEVGIEDKNFVEVAEQLYKERLSAIETF